MEEIIDVLNPDGTPTGKTKPKSAIHRDGDWHRTAHVWVMNSKKELLIQLRSPLKVNDPNVWDISAAGHVSAGETSRVGAVRELKEELGIDALPDELVYIGENRCDYSLRNGTYIDREIQDVYLANKDVIVDDLVLQPEEVVEAKWIYFTQLEKDLKFHQERYTDQGGEYPMLFEYLSALS